MIRDSVEQPGFPYVQTSIGRVINRPPADAPVSGQMWNQKSTLRPAPARQAGRGPGGGGVGVPSHQGGSRGGGSEPGGHTGWVYFCCKTQRAPMGR